jgi:phasin family protein
MDQNSNPDADVKSSADLFSRYMHGVKLPGVDLQELLASQQKNLEALTKATHIAAEGAGAVARRQAEIVRNALEEAGAMMREHSFTGKPEEIVAKQAEFARKAFETAVANARELAEIGEKSGEEAFEVLKRRTSESLEEVRKMFLRK